MHKLNSTAGLDSLVQLEIAIAMYVFVYSRLINGLIVIVSNVILSNGIGCTNQV